MQSYLLIPLQKKTKGKIPGNHDGWAPVLLPASVSMQGCHPQSGEPQTLFRRHWSWTQHKCAERSGSPGGRTSGGGAPSFALPFATRTDLIGMRKTHLGSTGGQVCVKGPDTAQTQHPLPTCSLKKNTQHVCKETHLGSPGGQTRGSGPADRSCSSHSPDSASLAAGLRSVGTPTRAAPAPVCEKVQQAKNSMMRFKGQCDLKCIDACAHARAYTYKHTHTAAAAAATPV
eukprot:1159313-Pelagomonas_calceolata.AAC.6